MASRREESIQRRGEQFTATPEGQEALAQRGGNGKPTLRLDETGVIFGSFDELWRWCTGVSRSALIPDAYRNKPEDIMVAVQMGLEIGLRPMTALQNIGVVNGKPSPYGEILMALIRGAGVMDESVFEEHFEYDSQGNLVAAVSTMARVGGKPRTERFTIEDAKQAGLWMSGVGWKKYPKDLLLWKARHRNEKALFSDITHGLVPRELAEGDLPAEKTVRVEQVSALDDLVERAAARKAAEELHASTEPPVYDEPTRQREPGEDEEKLEDWKDGE